MVETGLFMSRAKVISSGFWSTLVSSLAKKSVFVKLLVSCAAANNEAATEQS